MTTFNLSRARQALQVFDFPALFTEELGWNHPGGLRADTVTCEGVAYSRRPIAELAGVIVFELTAAGGDIPDAKARAAVQTQIAQHYYENLLIFVDEPRAQSVWYWVKREGNKRYPRSHTYIQGQTGDLFLSKLAAMFVDIGELDETGNVPVVEAARRVQASFDVERVTKRFYDEFQQVQTAFQTQIAGIDDESDRRWYTSVILNRLMFVYFLQRKGFVDGDVDYLSTRLEASAQRGADVYYSGFLKPLFFEGFAKPTAQRSPETRALLGDVRYLNGGLFLPHPIEEKYGAAIAIPDAAFAALFGLFRRYSWHLDDTPGGHDDEINPAVLGYIFEKYINQKAFGAYYTREEITGYLCEQTIHRLILAKVAEAHIPVPGQPARPTCESVPELLMRLDAPLCKLLLHDILPTLSLLDPACGSGAFLVAAMRTLEEIYAGVIGRIPFLKDAALKQWRDDVERRHPSLTYFIKKRIITDNLYGVDIMPEAVEIARLRLFLALVAAAQTVDDLEPLPNIDFNILAGNSLIGLLRVDDTQYQVRLGEEGYTTLVARKNALVQQYRRASEHPDLRANNLAVGALRAEIERHRAATNATLDGILLDQFKALKIQYEQATWDVKAGREGKPQKRTLTLADIEALQPFHWGYEFDEVMNGRGGFDAVITNPPWEMFQTDEKEFFQQYSSSIQKNKLRIEDWKKQMTQLMADRELRTDWLAYASRFPYQSAYFKKAEQYKHLGTGKINLYQLFVEQCYNLLCTGGECGIVIPSGIYTDKGSTELRELLFDHTQITGLFGFENRKVIFEGVHRSFKFVVLTFSRGGQTATFPVTFMRHDVGELAHFPAEGALMLSVELIKRLSPGTWSMMEFSSPIDIQIAEKMLRFPTLEEILPDSWNVQIGSEFNITSDSHLFETQPGPKRLPLFTGKMFHQFCGTDEHSGYWIEEQVGRSKILGRDEDTGQPMDYQSYRWVYRRIARNTDTRTMISTIAPPNVFTEVNSPILKVLETGISNAEMLFLCGITNSFVLDWMVRQKVTTTLNYFYVYQLPIPRLTASDPAFWPIVARAAKLICTTPEFDDLARDVGLGDHTHGVTDPVARARLRAELDGLIAHVYGLTEAEFVHILGAFPLVAEPVKVAAHNAYRDVERGLLP